VLEAILPHKDKLYRYALHLVKDVMLAEDIVQEVLVKVWKNKAQLKTIDNKEAWCMRVTRNLSFDKLRRKKAPADSVEEHYGLADDGMTPDRQLQSSDTMNLIKDAINSLPGSQSQIVHLREVEEYTYQEIADVTGFTVDKVKVSLHRARITLRERLESIYVS